MNVCSIWPFAQISDNFYYLDIWQCARYFVTALFKELAVITIREMWGLKSRTCRSRSRLLWQSLGLGLVSKFEPGLGLGDYGLDYITDIRITNFTTFRLKLADQDWIGLRKFLLFWCDYSNCIKNFCCNVILQICWKAVYILPSMAKALLGLFCYSNYIHVCPDST